MHTDILYSGSVEEKDAKALRDLADWFGDKWPQLDSDFRNDFEHEGLTFKQLRFYMSFGGVQGYPVEAYARSIGMTIPDKLE